jgi:hypothetical protein
MLPQLAFVGFGLFVHSVQEGPPVKTRVQQRAEVDAYAAQRTAQINALLTVAKDNIDVPGRRGVASVAVRKLSRMRATEAVDFLVEHLTFRGLADEGGAVSPIPILEESVPCVCALAEIGLPGFPRLLQEVEKTDADTTHRFAAMVFRRSMGEAHSLAFLGLQHDSTKDETKRKRLKSTMEQVRKVKDVP